MLALKFEQVMIDDDSLIRLINIKFEIESLQQRTLSRTNFTDNIYELPLVNMEIHVGEYRFIARLIDIDILIANQHIYYDSLLLN